jgi:hypothetical protein
VDRKVGVTFWRGPENRGNIASGLEKRTSMRKGRANHIYIIHITTYENSVNNN